LPGQLGSEARRDDDADPDASSVHQSFDLSLVVEAIADVKVARGREPVRKGAAGRGPVQIADCRGQILDVRGDGVSQEDQLQYRQDEENGQQPPVPADLDELLLTNVRIRLRGILIPLLQVRHSVSAYRAVEDVGRLTAQSAWQFSGGRSVA
jgi:hypothetical protein